MPAAPRFVSAFLPVGRKVENIGAGIRQGIEFYLAIQQAHDAWLKVLPLLPPESTQAAWVQRKVRSLEVAAKAEEAAPPKPKPKAAKGRSKRPA